MSDEQKPSATQAEWQQVDPPKTVHFLTLAVHVPCAHCALPVPVNGPSQRAKCSNCLGETAIDTLIEEEGVGQGSFSLGDTVEGRVEGDALTERGASIQAGQLEPSCAACGAAVPVHEHVRQYGAVGTIPCPACGAGLPTFPAPGWLRAQMPSALQIFGGDPEIAKQQAGIPLAVRPASPKPVAMACPACGGGLTITAEAERTTECKYCQSSVFIPDPLWRALHPAKTMREWTISYYKLARPAVAERICRQCAAPMAADQRFCGSCGFDATLGPPPPGQAPPPTAYRPPRKWPPKKIALAVFILLAAIAPLVALPFMLMSSTTGVQGQVAVDDPKLGTWTLSPERCSSGDFWWRPFFGAHFGDGKRSLRVLNDKVQVTGGGETLSLRERDCKVYRVGLSKGHGVVEERSGKSYRTWSGQAQLECSLPSGGSLTADLSFENCGSEGAVQLPPPDAPP